MDVPFPPIRLGGGATVTVVPVLCRIKFCVLFTTCTCCWPLPMSCVGPPVVRAKMLAAPDTVIALGYAVRESSGEEERDQEC